MENSNGEAESNENITMTIENQDIENQDKVNKIIDEIINEIPPSEESVEKGESVNEENEDNEENEENEGRTFSINVETIVEVPVKLLLLYKEIIEVIAKRGGFVKEEAEIINKLYQKTLNIIKKSAT